MQFIKITDIQPVIDNLAKKLKIHLKNGEKVSWIITGGSSMPIVVAVCRQLEDMDLSKLSVTLSDERFGPTGHADSNWEQLKQLGFFLPGANLQPVLTGKSLEATTADYREIMKQLLTQADYKIGLIGIGADGHIAGIKAASPGVDSPDLATSYKWDDYVRLTMTPRAIEQLDEVICIVMGEAKHQALKNLEKDMNVNQQPAQILKSAKSAAVYAVYNDLIGE